jgi:hypothetical protein
VSLTAKLYLLGALTLSMASAGSLAVVNPNFSAVAVLCSGGYADQSFKGGNCEGPTAPQQDFNSSLGTGWTFALIGDANPLVPGAGATKPNTAFNPPSFSGLPFSQAAVLQGPSAIAQITTGFVPGGQYTLSFYLGSRQGEGCCDGNQTVQVTLDNQVLGTWPLVSFTPFTLQTAAFTVASGGPHVLKFAGIATGDHTAFFSGVGMETAGGLTVNPSAGVPGSHVAVSASGFAPSETVTLFAYANVPTAIGTATADTSGNATVEGQIPQTSFGTCGLQAVGQSSGTVASGTISVGSRLLASPTTGTIGESVTVTGFGFAAGEEVNVKWLSPQTLLGSAVTNGNGSFSGLTFAIPSGVAPGSNAVIATGQKSGAVAGAQIIVQ